MIKEAAHLLVNYRRICNDFKHMKSEDEEYDLAKKYIETMQMYFNKLNEAKLPETNFLEKSGLTTNQLRALYIDTLNMAYFSDKHMSSLEMTTVINKKYGLNMSISRFTVLKEYSVIFFSSLLPE